MRSGLDAVLAAHRATRDLTYPVFLPAAVVGALGHGRLMSLEQEGWCARGHPEPLLASDLGKILVMLAGPVHVDLAGRAVPLLVRCQRSAIRALHDRLQCSRS